MSSLYPDVNTAVDAALRFNVAFFNPAPVAPTRLLPQLDTGDVVEPTVVVIKGRHRTRHKLRTGADLWILALGGDIEYILGHFLEVSWTNDGVRIELQLLPKKTLDNHVTFRGTLNLFYGSSRIVSGHDLPEVSFERNEQLLVPSEALEILKSYKR